MLWYPGYGFVMPTDDQGGCLTAICSGKGSQLMKKLLALLPERWRVTTQDIATTTETTATSRRAQRRASRRVSADPTGTAGLPPLPPAPGAPLVGYFALLPGWNATYLGQPTTTIYALRYGSIYTDYGLAGAFGTVEAALMPQAIPLN